MLIFQAETGNTLELHSENLIYKQMAGYEKRLEAKHCRALMD